MKYNVVFLLIFTLIAVSGCKLFKRPSPENLSAITADTTSEVIRPADSAYYVPSQNATTLPGVSSEVSSGVTSGNYYMIVGCFTVSANAQSYATNLRQKGYNTTIVTGRDNYQMVSVQTYSDYKSSIAEIEKYRNEITPGAWVHVAR